MGKAQERQYGDVSRDSQVPLFTFTVTEINCDSKATSKNWFFIIWLVSVIPLDLLCGTTQNGKLLKIEGKLYTGTSVDFSAATWESIAVKVS